MDYIIKMNTNMGSSAMRRNRVAIIIKDRMIVTRRMPCANISIESGGGGTDM